MSSKAAAGAISEGRRFIDGVGIGERVNRDISTRRRLALPPTENRIEQDRRDDDDADDHLLDEGGNAQEI